jgi:hypothetical protein
VTLTLSANAAEDIGGVISAIADLLKIAVPPTYELTRTPSPEMFKLNMTRKHLIKEEQNFFKRERACWRGGRKIILKKELKLKRL